MRKQLYLVSFLVLSLLVVALAVAVVVGRSNTPTTSPSNGGTTVIVNPNGVLQTIAGLGGNYAKGRFEGEPEVNDAIGRANLASLKPAQVRVGLPLKGWEPINDDADPASFNWDKFNDNGNVHNIFLLLQTLKKQGCQITLSIWDVPDWMVSDPGEQENRRITDYPEVVESIMAFLIKAHDDYGVTITYLSFNEADVGANISLAPNEYGDIIRQTAVRLAKEELPTKWLIGDTSKISTLVKYVTPLLQDSELQPYLGPVAFHSWDSSATDADLSNIAALASQYNKAVWCTELGYDADLWKTNLDSLSGWDNAWRLAQIYYRVLKFSRASVVLYWEYEEDYPLIEAADRPYPAYYVVKQLVDALPPGSQLLEANSSNDSIWTLATRSDKSVRVQLINTSHNAVDVTIKGLPKTNFKLLRTSETEKMKQLGNYSNDVTGLFIQLPPQSISTLVGE